MIDYVILNRKLAERGDEKNQKRKSQRKRRGF